MSTREKRQPLKLREAWVSEERELVTEVGARVDVLWTEEDLKGTKLTPGWYEGEVQEYDDDQDVIRVLYKNDEGGSTCRRQLFDLAVSVAIAEGLVKLRKSKNISTYQLKLHPTPIKL